MNELVRSIVVHKNSNNPKVIFNLLEYIKKHSVNSLDDLQRLEDEYFTPVESTKDDDLTIINKLYSDYNDNYDDYMNCTSEEQSKLDELNEDFLQTNDVGQKYIDGL